MPQPIKKSGPYQKPRSKTVKKRINSASSKQDERLPSQKNPKSRNAWKKRPHPEYGTSKLEEKFAKEFLDKLGVKYIYQFKAESIGRYYDFRIIKETTYGKILGPCIELQGSYWHGDKRIYEEKDLNAIQKKNIRVDEIKRKWCSRNGIPLIYVWEKDIRSNPDVVLNYLRDILKKFIAK